MLPYVEDGTITLIGATTENPSFEVISPLLSRSRVFKLEPLIAGTNVGDPARGARGRRARHRRDEGGRGRRRRYSALATIAGGDARIALNALELAAQTARPEKSGRRTVTSQHIEEALQKRAALYDRAGDWHYDTSRRSSSRCAGRTRTRRCTGWRGCWRAARTRSSSRAGW